MSVNPNLNCLRIATEEAFATPELFAQYRRLLESGSLNDPGFTSLWGFYLGKSEVAQHLARRIQDLGEERLRDMDATGVAMQILSLTAPGVQVFDAPLAVALARDANDVLADAVRRHPTRFAGLAAVAPQDPAVAARELERAVSTLGLRGAIINSHTFGEYLDAAKFWPIFEAAQALDVPVYLHPTAPSPAMIQPFIERGLDGAIFGFGVETGLHLLRLIVAGVFDRFPRLKLVVGHLGEALPFWLFRIDFMHERMVRSGRYPHVGPLRMKPSDYMRTNVWVTSSGMSWQPAIRFVQEVLGSGRVMYAMDYPFQFVPEEVGVTDTLPVDADTLARFYQHNAVELFGLPVQ